MYDNFQVANYPNALLSPELYGRHLSRLWTGDVIDGFTVTPGTGMQVVLAPGNAFVRYGSSAVASARFVSLVDNFNLAVETADASNPRIDVVVVYVDNDVDLPDDQPPTSANLDGKGVAKAILVKGTAAATPSAPNATAIQAAVGSGNPYTVVAQVRVDAGVSVIASNKVTDARSMAKLGADKLDLTTSTDSNGWTRKGVFAFKDFSISYSAVPVGGQVSLTAQNLPVGARELISAVSTDLTLTAQVGDFTSTTFTVRIRNLAAGSTGAGTAVVRVWFLIG